MTEKEMAKITEALENLNELMEKAEGVEYIPSGNNVADTIIEAIDDISGRLSELLPVDGEDDPIF